MQVIFRLLYKKYLVSGQGQVSEQTNDIGNAFAHLVNEQWLAVREVNARTLSICRRNSRYDEAKNLLARVPILFMSREFRVREPRQLGGKERQITLDT